MKETHMQMNGGANEDGVFQKQQAVQNGGRVEYVKESGAMELEQVKGLQRHSPGTKSDLQRCLVRSTE